MRLTFEVNSALVAKLVWAMLTNKESLWVKVLGGKYLRGHSFQAAQAKTTNSWIWKSIIKHRDALMWGLCFKVGKAMIFALLRTRGCHILLVSSQRGD